MTQRKLKGTRVYEQVVEEVKQLISSGELKPGDPLPSERQLMQEIGVSRSSLREAFRILELIGLIESIPGKGRFVRKPRTDNKETSMVPLEDEAILELMEARRILDPAISKAAAMHALPSNLTKIRKILSKTSQNIDDLSQRAKLDYDFHLALAEATHNFIFVNVVKMTFNLIMATHERIYSLLNDKEAFLNEHKEIYEAIVDHNMDLAANLAAKHIDRIYKTLQEAMAQ